MRWTRRAGPRAQVRRLLPQVRAVFFVVYAAQLGTSVVSWVVQPLVPHARSWTVLLALGALGAVAWHRLRTRSTPLLLDAVAAAGLATVSWGTGLEQSYGILFVGAIHRSLYGRWPALLGYLVLHSGVLVAWAVASGSQVVTASVIGDVPGLVCMSGAFHLLAGALHRYETGNESRFQALVRGSSDVILVTDAETAVTYASPALPRVFGPAPGAGEAPSAATSTPAGAEVAGRPERLVDWVVSEDREGLVSRVQALVSADAVPAGGTGADAGADAAATGGAARATTATCRVRDGDGALRHVEMTVQDARAVPGVGGLIVNARDVTTRVEMAEQLRHQALHDALTGLANRVLLADRLERALAAREGAVAVLLVDLDGFKAVNDTYGHAAGDELLVAIAQRLRSCVRAEDTAARLGGDEFAVLLTGEVPEVLVREAGERLLTAIGRPVVLEQGTVHPAASIGAVLAARPRLEERTELVDVVAEGLLHRADAALYEAKAAGAHRMQLCTPEQAAAAPGRPATGTAGSGATGPRVLHLQHDRR